MVTKEDLEKDYIDAGEAKKILGLSGSRMSRLCTGERFPGAFKFGSIWIIPREAVQHHTKLKPGVKRGRPRKDRIIEEGTDILQKKRGRPSRGKAEVKAAAAASEAASVISGEAPKKRGRPKGSTNKTKAKTVTKARKTKAGA